MHISTSNFRRPLSHQFHILCTNLKVQGVVGRPQMASEWYRVPSISTLPWDAVCMVRSIGLSRAPLGHFYNAPHWGGGAISSPPPLISETTGPILKIQAAFESPGKTVEGKQILLTSGSWVTSQVRSKSKCLTFRAWWHRRAKLRC